MAADPYVDLDRFGELSVMPAVDVEAIEARSEGWIEAQSSLISRQIDGKLAKRYAVPFAAPPPEVVEGWVVAILTARGYVKRGSNPGDEQMRMINDAAERAWKEIDEAADSKDGRFDLPLRADTSASGVARGGPDGVSEQSPFAWRSKQSELGRNEDIKWP